MLCSNLWLRPAHRRVTFPIVLSNQAGVGTVQESGFLASNKLHVISRVDDAPERNKKFTADRASTEKQKPEDRQDFGVELQAALAARPG